MAEIKSATGAHHKPYAKGQPITLICDDWDNEKIFGEIREVFEPFTLSCVLYVRFAKDGALFETVVKLYDRRFAAQLRKENGVDPWTEETEAAYRELVANGEAAEFLRKLREDDDFDEPEEGWSAAENEVYLHDICSETFSIESRAYEKLKPLQGDQIPEFFTNVTLSLDSGNQKDPQPGELTSIKGIMIEYIPGPRLSNMTEYPVFPKESWISIAEIAMQIPRSYAHLGVVNKDVRLDNIVVSIRRPLEGKQRRVVMVDLGLCEFREPGQSDAEWGRKKWHHDEVNAIGAVMQTTLRKAGVEMPYTWARDWNQWGKKEGDDD